MTQRQNLKYAFINAFHGLKYVFSTQRNAFIHSLITLIVIFSGIYFKINAWQWTAIIFAIGLVWATECINTAIEKLTDLVTPEFHVLAKVAKDCAAAGVLISAIASVVIGLIIFLPKFLDLF